jgi:hypothetical protein
MTAEPDPAPRRYAALVVHGMGQQKSLDTESGFAARLHQCIGLERVEAAVVQEGGDRLGVLTCVGHGAEVSVFEAYWAPETEGLAGMWEVIWFLLLTAWNGLQGIGSRFSRTVFGQDYQYQPRHATMELILLLLCYVTSLLGVCLGGALVGLGTLVEALFRVRIGVFCVPGLTVVAFWGWPLPVYVVGAHGLAWLVLWLTKRIGASGPRVLTPLSAIAAGMALWSAPAALDVGLWRVTEVECPSGASPIEWTWFGALLLLPLIPIFVAFGTGAFKTLAYGWLGQAALPGGKAQGEIDSAARADVRLLWLTTFGTLVVTGIASYQFGPAVLGQPGPVSRALPWWHLLPVASLWLLLLLGYAFLRYFLVQFVGDVMIYVFSFRSDRFDAVRKQIRDRVANILASIAMSDRARDGVAVVAHSLGSVVAFDALNAVLKGSSERCRPGADRLGERLRLLLTFGSPLDKIAYFFDREAVRRATAEAVLLRNRLVSADRPLLSSKAARQFSWVNLYSPLDLVSGRLDYYDPPRDQPVTGYRPVENIRDPQVVTPLMAHVEFEERKTLYRLVWERLSGSPG